MHKHINVSVPKPGIKIIQLNRPRQMNSLNVKILEEITQELKESDSNPTIRCNILTGHQGFFAVGADIKELHQYINADSETKKNFEIDYFEMINKIQKPIIASVDGLAFGGGFELALNCDFIISTKSSNFGLPEIKLGLIPGKGGSQRLSKIVGVKKAMELVMLGSNISSEEALKLNIINKVVEDEIELERETIKFASKIVNSSPKAIQYVKQSIKHSEESLLSDGIKYEFKFFLDLLNDKDQHEGIKAFLQKRKPEWKL